INNIISARAKEIFDIIAYDVINSKMDNVIPVGMILTGGTSKLKGIAGFAEAMLKMPVRLGIPKFVKGRKEVIENPENAAVIGLLLYSMENADFSANNISKKRDFFDANIFTSAFSNLKTLKEKFF
ncbi:MAG TPA: hypothetical protein PLQ81_07925, partial [bacterium]|nr:hypothetical protein [bacterium]